MHSIRYRIAIPTVLAIIVSVLIIGLVGIFSIKDIGDRSSVEILTLQSERAAQKLDAYMNSVVQAVETVSRYTEADLNDVSDVTELTDRQMHYHLIRVKDIFDTVARNTRGAMTYYYRVAPEISRQEQDFWYSRFGLVYDPEGTGKGKLAVSVSEREPGRVDDFLCGADLS